MTHESSPSPGLTQALQSSKILVTVGADFRQLCPCGCGMPGMNAEIKIDVDLKIGEQSLIAMIAALYEVLAIRQPSPVVELNRAVALSMAFGPAVGLEIVDQLMEEPALKQYPWLPSVRADLLARLGRNAEAKEEFERAAAMTANARERELLLRRAREQGH